MAKNVKFNRLKNKAFATGSSKDADTIYFTTDTHQIILGGQVYGDWDYKTLAQLVGGSAIGSATQPIYWNGSAFAQANAYPTVGNGTMSILANGFSTFAFTANQTTDDSVNFVGEKGVTVSSGTKQVIISGTNHHTVAAKTEVVRAKSQKGSLYIQQIKCENLGGVLYVANLNDISSDAKEKAPANANYARFIKSEVDDDFWIGLFGAYSTAGRYAFNITVSHTSGYEEHYKFLVVEDTPGTGTFSFVTDCPWDMTARYKGVKLVCFAKLPKEFIGYVRIQPERIHLSSGSSSFCFETWDNTTDVPSGRLSFTNNTADIIATGSSIDIVSKFTTSQVNSLWSALDRTSFPAKPGGDNGPINPLGKYTDSPVNMIVDLGVVTQGDYITDFEINDMLLHELESKVGNHDVRITTLENTVAPSLGYWTYENGNIYANSDIIVRPSVSGKTGKVEAPGGFFQTSDIRKKNVLGELDLNKAYDLIDKCQTIIYSLKNNPDHVDIGLIAQEVQQFFPEIVSEDDNGMLSLDYAKLIVVILRVLKDLIARVSKLETK